MSFVKALSGFAKRKKKKDFLDYVKLLAKSQENLSEALFSLAKESEKAEGTQTTEATKVSKISAKDIETWRISHVCS